MADQGLPESLLTVYTVGPDLEAGARSSFIWGPQKGERGDGRGCPAAHYRSGTLVNPKHTVMTTKPD